jgi:hypothetical protein
MAAHRKSDSLLKAPARSRPRLAREFIVRADEKQVDCKIGDHQCRSIVAQAFARRESSYRIRKRGENDTAQITTQK